ncbi:NAD-dependent epimerase/dehydratase family protein [Segnochrobactrum spirostomi]|uniref:NAD-dependent epimerase/dehydratase family protein n=1 Tax=Segnochrobactrum spirostomi TaxID=2608987 RepID=A0A6A7Y7N4_9HYPH|nr:NAD-dependent epimerase/dehydratase family protein [Segnochrobactrum spirostomi]MQT15283.1 NAD-dependent epimerase/dehydratase family protein [Segnochrobactrum spirostomi]
MTSTQTHLLIGGAGFIGRHVAFGLLRRAQRIIVADRVTPERGDTLASECVEFINLDLTTADWDELICDVDVVHLYAWSSIPASANANPLGDLHANLGVTLGLLEALRRRGRGRLVFTSSGGTVYGRVEDAPIPEYHRLSPITAYGAGKATAELYLGLYRELYGLDCRIARLSNPYGAGQDTVRGQGAVTTFIHRALDGEKIVIWGDGSVVRDYVHISDVVNALISLADIPVIHGSAIYNVGSGEGHSLNDIVAELERQLGRELSVMRNKPRPFDVPVNILDISRAKRDLSWGPSVSFADGVARTIDDIRRGASLSFLQ